MLNYNQIIELNREFATNHKIIKNFGNGPRWKIVEHNQQATFKYPLMWMEDLPHPSSPGSFTTVFRVYFLDQVASLKERGTDLMTTNENVVKSDMEQCAQDLISFWAQDHDYPLLDIDKNITVNLVEDTLEDVVAGGYFDLKITQAFVYNKCAIPMVGVTAPDSSEVSIIGNSVLMSTVLCGQTYSFSIKDSTGTQIGTFDSLTKVWTVDACEDVAVTFNTVPVFSTPSGETKAVTTLSQAANPVGDVIVDDPNTLTIQIADSTIKNAATPTWTDTIESEQPYTLDPQPYTDSDGTPLTQTYDPAVPIVCTPAIALPTAGLNIPISWTGVNLVHYNFQVASNTPNVYNTISRTSSAASFDRNIFSIQTMVGNEDWVIEGDNDYNASSSQFWGFGVQSNTGINYVDIDFCIFIQTAGVIQWIESGVNTGTIATLTASNYWSWRLEYNGTTKIVSVYINGNLVHTKNTGYTTQTLVVKHCGRNSNHQSVKHLNLRKVASSNRILVPFGDSITAIDPASTFPGRSYVEKMIAFSNHKYFVNPVLAVAGATTSTLISTQLPLAAIHYKASYTSNVANLMIGINDLQLSVALATIQTNIQTIVSSLQTTGYYVIIHTILKDHGTDWADRYPLNTWILAGSSGADYVIDHTTSVLETDSSYFNSDGLHPNSNGTTQIALESYPALLTAP